MKKKNGQNGHKEPQNDDSISANSESYKRGEHPNSKANLNPFEKGVSGNPSGRPSKYENLKKVLKKMGNEPPDFIMDDEGPRKKQVWCRIWYQALMGDIRFIQLLADWGCLDE